MAIAIAILSTLNQWFDESQTTVINNYHYEYHYNQKEERQEIIIKDIDKTTIIDCLPVNPQDEEE